MTAAGGFCGVALAFGTNRLKRSLSVIGGNTRGSDTGSDTLTAVVGLVRDVRGANLMYRSWIVRYGLGEKQLAGDELADEGVEELDAEGEV